MNEKLKATLDLDINPFKQKSKEAEKTSKRLWGYWQEGGKTLNIVYKDTKELSSNMEEVEQQSVKTTSTMGDGFSKAVNKVKKVGFSLLKIRSIYSLLSRASSSYLSQDTELANKLQAVWTGLGSLLAPVIEKLVNILLKGVAYINVFIKALTGVDLMQKAIKKSSDSTNKSVKSLNKTLAGFDELTNLKQDTSSGLANASWVDAYKNIELNQDFVNALEDVGTWIKDHTTELIAFGTLLLSIFGGVKLATVMSGMKTMIGTSSTGLMGIGTLLKYITSVGAVIITLTLISNVITESKKIKNSIESIRESARETYKENVNNMETLTDVIEEQTREQETGKEAIKQSYAWYNKLTGLSKTYLNNAQETVTLSATTLDKMKEIYSTSKLTAKEKQTYLDALKKQYNYNEDIIEQLEQEGIDTKDLKKINQDYEKEIYNVNSELKKSTTNTNSLKDSTTKTQSSFKSINTTLEDTQSTLNTLGKTDTKIKVGADTSKAKEKLKNFFSGMTTGVLNTVFGIGNLASFLKKLASLDTGTNYVPNDQLAMIHKGEAVIPKKFNNKEYFNNTNEQTNELLNKLINVVDSKEFKTYLDGKEIGKSSVNYINKESRIQGRSVLNI